MSNAHEFSHRTIDGEEKSLADYRGRPMLIVNVASQCGLTPQYSGLQKLHETYGERGLVVAGFPCNQFGAQEPGTEDEIKTFCETQYSVTFPMFAKLDVNGDSAHPLYQWLTSQDVAPEGKGPVKWNFGKFLIGKNGELLARFSPKTAPDAPDLTNAIEAAL